MKWQDHIEINENVLLGKPAIKGTRIAVDHITKLLASGWTTSQILENYPRLTNESLQAVFIYINELVNESSIYNSEITSA